PLIRILENQNFLILDRHLSDIGRMKTVKVKPSKGGKSFKVVSQIIAGFPKLAPEKGVIKDLLPAFRKVARLGSADANAFLGYIYAEGFGVRKDLVKSVIWHRRAAGLNQSYAQAWLGYAYGTGFGVKKNLKMALYWDRRAARKGF